MQSGGSHATLSLLSKNAGLGQIRMNPRKRTPGYLCEIICFLEDDSTSKYFTHLTVYSKRLALHLCIHSHTLHWVLKTPISPAIGFLLYRLISATIFPILASLPCSAQWGQTQTNDGTCKINCPHFETERMQEGESHPYTSRYRPQVDPGLAEALHTPRLNSHLSKCHHLHATSNLLMKQSRCFSVGTVLTARPIARPTSRSSLDCQCCANRTAEPWCYNLCLFWIIIGFQIRKLLQVSLKANEAHGWGLFGEYSTGRSTTLVNKSKTCLACPDKNPNGMLRLKLARDI